MHHRELSSFPYADHFTDDHSFSAFTSASAGNGKTTQTRRLCAEDRAALEKGAAFSLSSEKVTKDGLALGGAGSTSLDSWAISGRYAATPSAQGASSDVQHSSESSPAPTDDWVPRTIPRILALIGSSSGLSTWEVVSKLFNVNVNPVSGSEYSDPQTSPIGDSTLTCASTLDRAIDSSAKDISLAGLVPAPTDDWVPRTIPRNHTLIDSSGKPTDWEVVSKLFNIRPIHGSKYGDEPTKRIRRFYQRFYTGVGVGGQLRVLTLTTSNEALAEGKDIHRSFRTLVKRLRRKFGRFEYIGVKEFNEDREHLHLVFRGEYMPQDWVSDTWKDIHSSPIVYIEALQNERKGVQYLAKYLSKDMHNRFLCSQNWVFKGWVTWSKQFCKQFGHYPHQSVLQSLARLDVERRKEVQQQHIKHERYFVPFHRWRDGCGQKDKMTKRQDDKMTK